jgi:hypothetical protein
MTLPLFALKDYQVQTLASLRRFLEKAAELNEYEGEHISTADDSKEKLPVGELWAGRSNEKCLFLVIENKEFSRIDRSTHVGRQ